MTMTLDRLDTIGLNPDDAIKVKELIQEFCSKCSDPDYAQQYAELLVQAMTTPPEGGGAASIVGLSVMRTIQSLQRQFGFQLGMYTRLLAIRGEQLQLPNYNPEDIQIVVADSG